MNIGIMFFDQRRVARKPNQQALNQNPCERKDFVIANQPVLVLSNHA
jgi:hypothetical protein